jgi:hypothetical protein
VQLPLQPAPRIRARRGDARPRLGQLHCVAPKCRAAQINAVNTMPAVGPLPASPKRRSTSGASRATATCPLTATIRRELNPTRLRRPPLHAPTSTAFQCLVDENPSVERRVLRALARRVDELSRDPTLA